MNRFAAILGAALALVACAVPPVSNLPAAPVVVANSTILDEKVGIAVETAYKAFRVALELGVDAGQIRGERATRLAAIDRRAYAATLATQAAYRSTNSTSYVAASREAIAAITLGIAVLKGR